MSKLRKEQQCCNHFAVRVRSNASSPWEQEKNPSRRLAAPQIRKELFIVDEEQKHVQFAKTFLVGWDNSLSNEQVGAGLTQKKQIDTRNGTTSQRTSSLRCNCQ